MNIKSDKAEGQKSAGGGVVQKKLVPFGGYYTSKVPGHDPELTETGPGTPMGNLFRQYWIPALPGINYPGDYQQDYAHDPVAWIKREQTGEFEIA